MINSLLNKNCFYPLNKGEHYIYDNHENDKPNFVDKDGKWSLKIINNSTLSVNFYQNDNCIMTQNELKKCDWVIPFQNDFYFIEAKDVGIKKRAKQRREAIEKFNDTIPYFLREYSFIKDMNLKVIMNFRNKIKLTRSANKSRALYFDQKFNASYIETNCIEFN